jgi:amino acid permease
MILGIILIVIAIIIIVVCTISRSFDMEYFVLGMFSGILLLGGIIIIHINNNENLNNTYKQGQIDYSKGIIKYKQEIIVDTIYTDIK